MTAVLEAVVLVNRRAKDTEGEWADAVVVDAIGASLRYATVTLGADASTPEEAN